MSLSICLLKPRKESSRLFCDKNNFEFPPISETAQQAISTVLSSVISFGIVTNVLSGVIGPYLGSAVSGMNPQLLWTLMNLLQGYFYLNFLNLKLPPILESFLLIFRFANLGFLPNVITLLEIELDDLQSPPNFYINSYTGLSFQAAGPNLELFLVVYAAWWLAHVFKKKMTLLGKIAKSLDGTFPVNFLINSVTNYLIAALL